MTCQAVFVRRGFRRTRQIAARASFTSTHALATSTMWAILALLFCGCPTSILLADTVTGNAQQAVKQNNIGVALMNQQLPDKALEKFIEAHRLDPRAPEPVINQGIALFYLHRIKEANQLFSAATQTAPNNPRIWYGLGLIHFEEGDLTTAQSDFQRCASLDSSNADTFYYLGNVTFGLKDYLKAATAFKVALKLNPQHASAEFGLARALQRQGDADEAGRHFSRFQELSKTPQAVTLTTLYGEQGLYATAQEMRSSTPTVAPMIRVRFEAITVENSNATSSLSPTVTAAGVCIIDLMGDGHKDILSVSGNPNPLRAYRLEGNVLKEVSLVESGLKVDGQGLACAVGDYDNDGLPDIAVALSDRIVLFHNVGHGKFVDTTAKSGIHQLNRPSGLTFVDFDHDGDLDLFVTGSPLSAQGLTNVLWRNNGNSTFTEWTHPTGLAGSGKTSAITLSDVNNDRAVDLLTTGTSPAPIVYKNQRSGSFRAEPLYEQPLGPTLGIGTFDFDKDGWMDVIVTHESAPGLTVWKNVDGQTFKRVPIPLSGAEAGWGITPIDFDNDGWIDLAALVQTASGEELHIFRNCGPQGFKDVSAELGIGHLPLHGARSVVAVDLQGTGAADLVIGRAGIAPLVLRNVGGQRNHSLRITLKGLADNQSSIGTKVEVFAGGNWQKWEVVGSSGYESQGPSEIIAGIGSNTSADIVRLLWPSGVPQDEINVSAQNPVTLTELDRRGSSCPTLFAWNGTKYEFISDVIGAAVIGHWIAPGKTNDADPDEWIKIDGAQLQPRHGMLSVRFGEPMEEVNYLDQVRLLAVDHPDDTEVFPDEAFKSEPPFATGRAVLASKSAHALQGAWDNDGKDVLPTLARRDHEYVRDFKNLSYAGFANEHTLTLDIGPWSAQEPLRLFLHGFIEYFSATSMYAAWQAGIAPEAPSLDAQMPDGSWKRILDDVGFPAGLPRTIIVDLTGKLPVGSRRLRLRTNLQIYWDQILVDNGEELPNQIRQTELQLASATLALRGYPKQIEGATPGDLTYDYQQMSKTGPFKWERGSYTRFGDVTPLLTSIDDQYVVFGTGEDMDLEFSNSNLPALPPHWKRDYFFYANGFVKDMDFYDASPFTVGELPFHGMSSYPYPSSEHYPNTPSATAYRLDWNNRFDSGNQTQRFVFDYEPAKSTPKSLGDMNAAGVPPKK